MGVSPPSPPVSLKCAFLLAASAFVVPAGSTSAATRSDDGPPAKSGPTADGDQSPGGGTATLEMATGRPPAQPGAVLLPRPPFDYRLVRRSGPEAARKSGAPRFRLRSKQRNKVVDTEAWLRRHDLRLPTLPARSRGDVGALPAFVPRAQRGLRVIRAIQQPHHLLVFYGPDFSGGRELMVFGRKGDLVAHLDFRAFTSAPRDVKDDAPYIAQGAQWAVVRDGVLYVSHFHRTYARSSGGQNAYVSAVELPSGALLWRSAPLVANAGNFLLHEGYIVTGYGFTAEPDYLFLLDAATGETLRRTKVKSGPRLIFLRGRALYVRAYDTDYVFDLR